MWPSCIETTVVIHWMRARFAACWLENQNPGAKAAWALAASAQAAFELKAVSGFEEPKNPPAGMAGRRASARAGVFARGGPTAGAKSGPPRAWQASPCWGASVWREELGRGKCRACCAAFSSADSGNIRFSSRLAHCFGGLGGFSNKPALLNSARLLWVFFWFWP